MTTVHFDISMSLDGFITGPGEGAGRPLGEDDGRLHDWMEQCLKPVDRLGRVYLPGDRVEVLKQWPAPQTLAGKVHP